VNHVRHFRRACYAAAHSTGGTVTGFSITEHTTPNFHQATIQYRDDVVTVLGARDAPILAITRPRCVEQVGGRPSGPLEFIDEPDLVAALSDRSTFQVLTLVDLHRPLNAADWPHLNPTDIKYWKPATAGEALFNYWD
jgi:hypothetical protein